MSINPKSYGATRPCPTEIQNQEPYPVTIQRNPRLPRNLYSAGCKPPKIQNILSQTSTPFGTLRQNPVGFFAPTGHPKPTALITCSEARQSCSKAAETLQSRQGCHGRRAPALAETASKEVLLPFPFADSFALCSLHCFYKRMLLLGVFLWFSFPMDSYWSHLSQFGVVSRYIEHRKTYQTTL